MTKYLMLGIEGDHDTQNTSPLLVSSVRPTPTKEQRDQYNLGIFLVEFEEDEPIPLNATWESL